MNVCKSSSNLPQGPRKMHISSFLLSSLSQTPEHKAQERSACEGRPYFLHGKVLAAYFDGVGERILI